MIVTNRLTLTKPSQSSIPKVVGWLNDPKIMRYSEQRHGSHSEESQHLYIDLLTKHHQYMEIHYGNALIGTISALIDHPNSVADVGILIGERNAWGKGFGTEAWIAFCDHLLGHGVRKIEAGCMSINLGMIHVCRKTGMEYEGRRAAHFFVGDDTVDMIMFGRFV